MPVKGRGVGEYTEVGVIVDAQTFLNPFDDNAVPLGVVHRDVQREHLIFGFFKRLAPDIDFLDRILYLGGSFKITDIQVQTSRMARAVAGCFAAASS